MKKKNYLVHISFDLGTRTDGTHGRLSDDRWLPGYKVLITPALGLEQWIRFIPRAKLQKNFHILLTWFTFGANPRT